MTWQQLHDPDNPENQAAGNTSDWIKHTVWLTGLELLARQTRWQQGIELHACHAGRGIYRIAADDPRRQALSRLLMATDDCRLARAERAILSSIHANDGDYYAGSALLCHWWLAQIADVRQNHRHYLYEWHPDTRAILQRSLAAFSKTIGATPGELHSQVIVRDTHGGGRFDGESYVAEALPRWPLNSVLLMDPFSLWRAAKHHERRERIHRIMRAASARQQAAPASSLFFAWGKAQDDSLEQPLPPAYHELRDIALAGSHTLVEIRWAWGLHCSVWWQLPSDNAQSLAIALEKNVTQLTNANATPHADPTEPNATKARWRIHVT